MPKHVSGSRARSSSEPVNVIAGWMASGMHPSSARGARIAIPLAPDVWTTIVPLRTAPVAARPATTSASSASGTVSSSSSGINWTSWDSCFGGTCNATTGGCTGYLFLPRDPTFDVVPLLRPGLPWHDILNTASESDYG